MKLAKVLAVLAAAGALATDKKPEDLEAILVAADGMPGNVASSKEIEDKKGKDRAARDAKRAADRKAEDKKMADDRAAMDKAVMDGRAAMDKKFGEDRAAMDKASGACDAEDPMAACDAEMAAEDKAEKEAEDKNYAACGDPTTPGGSRAGGKTAVDQAADTAAAVQAALDAREALHVAQVAVEPIVGKLALDNAPDLYRAALTKLTVDTAGVHDSALASLLKIAVDKAAPAAPVQATDAATTSAMDKLIPGYSRL